MINLAHPVSGPSVAHPADPRIGVIMDTK
jgi:hypothetical protein